MSLIHDPSAIRYASTQEAYGTTWTLDRIEGDGAQIWKNSKGETAMVQRLPDHDTSGIWVFDGKDDTITFDCVGDFVVQGTITSYFPVVDGRSFDRCLTNEEVIQLYNEGPDSVSGGQVIDLTGIIDPVLFSAHCNAQGINENS